MSSQAMPVPDVPSSASVTVTPQATVSPKSRKPPLTGMSTVTSGRVLPAVISMLATPVAPRLSVTVSTAV